MDGFDLRAILRIKDEVVVKRKLILAAAPALRGDAGARQSPACQARSRFALMQPCYNSKP
jgi:hypothetical protein